jgi:spore coat protein U-like protein
MRSRHLIAAAALVASAALAGVAAADTATTTFTVSATVAQSCSVSATNLSFGAYAANGSAVNGTSTITTNCTVGTPFAISLDAGTGGGDLTTRQLAGSGTNRLNYNLYTDSARTAVWGDATGSSETVEGTGAGLATPIANTVYGRIPAGQDVAPDTYSSTITVTVTY